MSSLAGALAEPIDTNLQDDYINDDVEMDQHETDAHDDQHTDGAGSQADEEMGDDLFGENEDVDFVKHDHTKSARRAPETKSPTPASPPPDGLSSPDRRQRQALEYEEEEEPHEVIEQRLEAAVAIPNIPVPKSSDGQHWVIRMPNFVKVDSKPFHPDTYTGPEVEDPGNNEFDMGIKLTVENTVRWRWVKDEAGNDQR
ncbi:hypothetical protein EWM64_g7511 [Hericium alpestre]|uniref:Uncharacterized protein n=1 Tax=Hericium alpestre TaxID=135208 RepID=A0A4Y9ZP03_9AGAM|nr:hypothetical protein EWM64_g7511 [Hericium alpestre]